MTKVFLNDEGPYYDVNFLCLKRKIGCTSWFLDAFVDDKIYGTKNEFVRSLKFVLQLTI